MSFRILIAEDEPLIRRDLKELLEELGYQVVASAPDGKRAAEMTEQLKPDVIILDIVMPGIDGIELARSLSSEYPVIMLTAHSSPDLVRSARDAGVMAYLTKPFRKKDIAPAVELAVTHFLREHHLSERVRGLRDQLETRKLIDRAKGLLMQSAGIGEAEAHRQLQQLSMQRNLSLKEIAEGVIAAAK